MPAVHTAMAGTPEPRAIRRGSLAALALLLAIILQPEAAHAASVAGRFVEKGPGTPLLAVEVVLRRAADSTVVAHTVTSSDGRFRLDSLRFDRYLLRASLLGHESFVRRDLVLAEPAPDLDLGTIALTVSPIAIPGATVSTARATAIVAADRNIYLTKDMPSATSGTATDVLRTVPELDVDIDGNVSLRGSASVNIQFNGRAAPLKGEALTTYLRQMPASRIERVEVISNPSAKFDPEGMAGIVNLVLKDDAGMGLSGSINLSAGQRYSGTGARVAWQKGKVTAFGGLSGSFYRYNYQSINQRQSLLTSPASPFVWDAANKYRGRYGMVDASIDYGVTKRSTLYGTLNASRNRNNPFGVTQYVLSDSSQTVTSRYDRTDDGTGTNTTSSVTLGFQHTVTAGKDERSIEFIQNLTDGDSHNDGLILTHVPSGTGDQTSLQTGSYGYDERSIQVDDTHPLGSLGKLELGYRGAERRTTSASEVGFFANGIPVVTPLSNASDYSHREVFHSGYATVGSTFGRLSLQAGARAEFAQTTFDVRSTGQHFDHDYRSLFPSANLAWDFGKGRNARLTYSRRIERPSAWYLNPDVPAIDSLNRFVGNPYLGPRYTNSYSLETSWSGTRGSLRLSPYLRETVDNWDQVTQVDPSGVAISTYLNASSIRVVGATLSGSLRQTGRLGGTMTLGVSREHHDASNLSSEFRRDVAGWSASGNVTFKTTRQLDLQGFLRYTPPRALAQGRASSYTFSNLGARWKFNESATASLTVNDPFGVARFSSVTGDATYAQTSRTESRLRSVSASLRWTWGKSPQQKPRKQTAEQPQTEAPDQRP